MKWMIPPVFAGQMIEVSYASSNDGYVWKRMKDLSTREEKFFIAEIGELEFDPANSVPKGFVWESVSIVPS
jgi:hypothetical protein